MNTSKFTENFDKSESDERQNKTFSVADTAHHFLWWAAGRSPELMRNCGPVTRMKATAVGVFMTIVIFPLSWVAMMNLLAMGQLWGPFCFLGGLFWSVAVFSVDRTILVFHRNDPDVHTNQLNDHKKPGKNWKTWGKIATRFGLAIIVSVVISEAMIVTFLSGEINAQLATQVEIAIADARTKATLDIGDQKTALSRENAELKEQLENLHSRRNELEAEMLCEADGTCGTGRRNEGPDYRRKQAAYLRAADEYRTEREDIDDKITANNTQLGDLDKLVEDAKKARAESEEQANGFLARHEALFAVIWKSWSALLLYLAMALGLALLETTPLLQKTLSTDDEYDRLIKRDETEAALMDRIHYEICEVSEAIWKRVAEYIKNGKPKVQDEESGLVRYVYQSLLRSLMERLSDENPADFKILINLNVIGHPGIEASIELPKSVAEIITLVDLDDEIDKIGKRLDEDGLQFVWAQNSSGGEVFVGSPLLEQLNDDYSVNLLYGKAYGWH